MIGVQAFDLKGALLLQIILSFYYIFFVIRPLSEIEKITGKMNYGYRLFITRVIVLFAIDLIDPTLASFLDVALLFTLAIVTVPKIKKEYNYVHQIDTKLAKYNELTDSDLTSFGIKNRKVLENSLFKTFVTIQTARSNYDYDALKHLCTEKLYSIYSSELEMLHETGLGYNFKDYKLLECQIYEINSNEKNIILKMAIKASSIAYRLDAKKNLVDGSKTDRTITIHELEFVKDFKTDDIELNCPNCGAPTKRSTTGKCQYCNTIIDNESTDWILSKNKVLLEKLVHPNNE